MLSTSTYFLVELLILVSSTSAHLVKKFSSRCYQPRLILSVIGLGKGRLSDRSVSDRRSKIRIRIRIDETCNERHLVFNWSANLHTTIIQPKAIKHYQIKITNKKGKNCSIGCLYLIDQALFMKRWDPKRPFIFTTFPHFQRILFVICQFLIWLIMKEDYWYTDRKTKRKTRKENKDS